MSKMGNWITTTALVSAAAIVALFAGVVLALLAALSFVRSFWAVADEPDFAELDRDDFEGAIARRARMVKRGLQ